MLATVVDTKALLETVAASFAAGVAVTFAFSVAILGAARSIEYRTAERRIAATLFAALGVVAFLAVVGAIVFGIVVITSK